MRSKVRGRSVRVFLSLTIDINNRLNTLMRYHEELSEYIDEALRSSDLKRVKLILVAVGRTARGITAVISGAANAHLRAAATKRACTMTELANSALHKWLGVKNV